MADKQHSDTQEKTETISYSPGLQNTGDLETGTHTIVPTTRPAIGSAQYSKSLTLPKPGDARLAVKRIAARLSVNIAGLGTATHVYLSVRVDVDDADHELFNEDWTSAGAKLDAVDTHSANKAAVFNLLKDGAAHTFYFLFWADVASQATIDVVQLWEAVGSCATASSVDECLSLVHTGLVTPEAQIIVAGSGTPNLQLCLGATFSMAGRAKAVTGAYYQLLVDGAIIAPGGICFNMYGTVATDLNYIHDCYFALRSEQ